MLCLQQHIKWPMIVLESTLTDYVNKVDPMARSSTPICDNHFGHLSMHMWICLNNLVANVYTHTPMHARSHAYTHAHNYHHTVQVAMHTHVSVNIST